ncbi:hypothetical protein [Thalassobius sp. Cn5-15]|uniref:hypothetical protein n=1 Tax=Thalassobius sp. Cn5-15 TaxID=2917763 RepID=UPI001EF217AA|nr:hypothetical protein [Thalassobius sp. Cn5-15]MCG7492950.1 hypothetical protein [Thalassobius sp. Cn5-15]
MTSTDNPVRLSLVPSSSRQAILERLFERAHIRRQMGMRPLDIQFSYWKRVQRMEVQEFERLLAPLLQDALETIEWPDERGARLFLVKQLHDQAAVRLKQSYGLHDPRSKPPDFEHMLCGLAPGKVICMAEYKGRHTTTLS